MLGFLLAICPQSSVRHMSHHLSTFTRQRGNRDTDALNHFPLDSKSLLACSSTKSLEWEGSEGNAELGSGVLAAILLDYLSVFRAHEHM